jgi:hypothetical protein
MISATWQNAIIILNKINALQTCLKIRHIDEQARNKQNSYGLAKLPTGLSTDKVEMFSIATQQIRCSNQGNHNEAQHE